MFVTVYVIVYVTAYNEKGDIPGSHDCDREYPLFLLSWKDLAAVNWFLEQTQDSSHCNT